MNISLYIAKRYLRSKSSNNAINIISNIALLGVILGTASLCIVLSGFAGLKAFTIEFSSVVDPDLKAVPAAGKTFILSDDNAAALNTISGVAQYSKIVEERIFIMANGRSYPSAFIKGVDANFNRVNAVDSIIEQGHWLSQKTNQIVMGYGISRRLSIGILDLNKPISIYVPKLGKGPINQINKAFSTVTATNVGIYSINEKLDDTYIYASIDLVQKLLQYDANKITAIEFKLSPSANEKTVKAQLKKVLGNAVIIKNRDQLNDALYKMLNGENLLVYLLLTLVSSLLIFNIIGSIIMMILEKKKSLNTLFNLGIPIKRIRQIFFIHGTLITIFGTITGLVIALLVIITQQTFGIVSITPSLAYPMRIVLENIVLVFVTISLLGVISAKLASSKITKKLIQR